MNKTPEVISDGAKALFRTRVINGKKVVVTKKGAPGTMRQNPRQASSSKMRNQNKRNNLHARLGARLEKPSVMTAAKKAANHLNMGTSEAWKAFVE